MFALDFIENRVG